MLAVEMLARGDSQASIAQSLGISTQSVWKWTRKPEFAAAVEAETERIRADIRAQGIAAKQNRIDAYNDRWQKMQTVITERGLAPDMQQVPGGKTGMILRTYKQVGSGRDAELVEEFSVDTSTLAEMRATEKQAAQEMRQWDEDSSDGDSGTIRGPVTIQIAALDYRASVARLTGGPMADNGGPGEDEDFVRGPSLGQDSAWRDYRPGTRP